MRGPREPEGLCVDQLGHELAQRCAWEVSLGAPVSQHFRSTVGDGSEDTSLAHVLTSENRQTDPPPPRHAVHSQLVAEQARARRLESSAHSFSSS